MSVESQSPSTALQISVIQSVSWKLPVTAAYCIAASHLREPCSWLCSVHRPESVCMSTAITGGLDSWVFQVRGRRRPSKECWWGNREPELQALQALQDAKPDFCCWASKLWRVFTLAWCQVVFAKLSTCLFWIISQVSPFQQRFSHWHVKASCAAYCSPTAEIWVRHGKKMSLR